MSEAHEHSGLWHRRSSLTDIPVSYDSDQFVIIHNRVPDSLVADDGSGLVKRMLRADDCELFSSFPLYSLRSQVP
jgi:hypothetical protein